jgi:hypothetical protein
VAIRESVIAAVWQADETTGLMNFATPGSWALVTDQGYGRMTHRGVVLSDDGCRLRARLSDIRRRHDAGQSLRSIAAAQGVHERTLRRWLRLTDPAEVMLSAERLREAQRLRAAGLSFGQIAGRLGGIFPDALRRVMIAQGLHAAPEARAVKAVGRRTRLAAEAREAEAREAEAVERYLTGAAVPVIAGIMRLSEGRVIKILTRKGVYVHTSVRPSFVRSS